MAGDDVKDHITSSHDFYELLGVGEGASEAEVRRAYRRTALKYHPDKVGTDKQALDKFHLLQIAYDVLSEPTVKELYDNARRARQQKAERDRAYEGRRKWMKEDLERRESGAFKRKREEEDEQLRFDLELQRLAEDGKRRRKEREEQLRREAGEILEDEAREANQTRYFTDVETPDADRSITLRYPLENNKLTKEDIMQRFERFGKVEDLVLREKRVKVDGKKHRQTYMVAVIVYKSIVGAHEAIAECKRAARSDPEAFGMFTDVTWATGQAPVSIRQAMSATPAGTPTPTTPSRSSLSDDDHFASAATTPATPADGPKGGLKKVPSFASFRGTPKGSTVTTTPGGSTASLDEITMIRLRNAERRRVEERIRREEAEADAEREQSQ